MEGECTPGTIIEWFDATYPSIYAANELLGLPNVDFSAREVLDG